MLATPRPDAADVRDNATYEALMWALARPGSVRVMPEPGLAPIALALVDRECRVATDDPGLASIVAETGAARVPAEAADHAFLASCDGFMEAIAALPAGSPLYPDEGATAAVAARLGEGAPIRLSGPGIETTVDVRIGGLPAAFWDLRAARCRYPAGIDLFFVDGDRVLGLPRSTAVEVL